MKRYFSIILLPFFIFSLENINFPKDEQVSAVSDVSKTDQISIPLLLNYQGKLTDPIGNPVRDSTYSITFRLFTTPTGGNAFWTETQTIQTRAGLFHTLLGSVNPITSLPLDGNCYLEMQVNPNPPMSPRIRIVSSAYSYIAKIADTANYAQNATLQRPITPPISTNEISDNAVTSAKIQDGTIVGADLNQMGASSGQVLKWTGTTWAPGNDEVGGDNAWVRIGSDSVLYTKNRLGIARGGSNNMLYGNFKYTHINLGVACTTGVAGSDIIYCTVNGGYRNTGSGDYATIGGGEDNTASGGRATVGGGFHNTGSGDYATIGGGRSNIASGECATVGGGIVNTASGNYAAVGGGWSNTASGEYATVGGGGINTASGLYATVGGGRNNTASDTFATVGGGRFNRASGVFATVAGGDSNWARRICATVGGGYRNEALDSFATVVGGFYNIADRKCATIGGGWVNRATYYYATVGGGCYNEATGFYATVGGGTANTASAASATVGGGQRNMASDYCATVAGGYGDTSAAPYSFTTNYRSVVESLYSHSAAFNGQRATASAQLRCGTLSKAGGSFTIDHPLDPYNKILNHYFIEGPEMRNIYEGSVILDANGRAEVRLPDYFSALNRNPHIQLTGVGTSDVYVLEDVKDNRFVIGGKPGTKVYWLVTGERADVSAEVIRRLMPVEQEKKGALRGCMLDDDFLSGCMEQLEREGKANGINFRTPEGRKRYEDMKRAPKELEREIKK